MTDEPLSLSLPRRMSAPAAFADPTNVSQPVARRASLVESTSRPPRRLFPSTTTPTPTPTLTPTPSPKKKRSERRAGGAVFSMDAIFSRDLRITGVSKKGASWRYHVEVLDLRNSLLPFTEAFSSPASASALPPLVRYTVMRRYNDFRQLYLYLVDYFGAELADALPRFPDGGLVSYLRGDDPTLLQFRKEQLQRFLRALDEHDDTKWSRAFRIFLNPEIDELATIGGATFAELVENYGRSTGSTTAPPPSTTSWADLNLARINANSGYVSLSHVKSPEIRFTKQLSDARGDWKRRKIERAMRGELQSKPRAKRLELEEPEVENPSDTSDDEEEEDDDDEDDEDEDDEDDGSPRKSSTELMKLLSLAPRSESQ